MRRKELPQVAVLGSAVVIADLHLDAFDEGSCEAFRQWVGGLESQQLFVLGDLFDAWVGPAHESSVGGQIVLDALRQFSEQGGQAHVLLGNRDFLLGLSFERQGGCRVHREGLVAELPNAERWLFLHGDELCTRDLAYQRLRRVTHSWLMEHWGPRAPLFISSRVARAMRRHSQRAVPQKSSAEKAIQESAAEQRVSAAACAGLLCGHVHQARDQALPGGQRWLILDAFGAGPRDALSIDGQGEMALVSSVDVSSGETIA